MQPSFRGSTKIYIQVRSQQSTYQKDLETLFVILQIIALYLFSSQQHSQVLGVDLAGNTYRLKQ